MLEKSTFYNWDGFQFCLLQGNIIWYTYLDPFSNINIINFLQLGNPYNYIFVPSLEYKVNNIVVASIMQFGIETSWSQFGYFHYVVYMM